MVLPIGIPYWYSLLCIERERGRDRDRDRYREREREREKETERKRERQTQRETDTHRQRHTHTLVGEQTKVPVWPPTVAVFLHLNRNTRSCHSVGAESVPSVQAQARVFGVS